MKLEKKDIIFVVLTFVVCFAIGLISNFVLQNVTEHLGILNKLSYVAVAIIATIIVAVITVLKSYFADKNQTTGTSMIKYIISMIVGFAIFFFVYLLVDKKLNTESGLASIFTLFAYVGLKILFDNHFEVRDYDFLSIPYIVLFLANVVLASFISIAYSSAIFWTVIILFVLRLGLGALGINWTPQLDRAQKEYEGGAKDALNGRAPKTINGDYYRGYLDEEQRKK